MTSSPSSVQEPAGEQSWKGLVIHTIGHSTRSQDEFIELLEEAKITTLVDLRSYPRSRHNPQFNKDVLSEVLPARGIRYVHLLLLGGRRKGLGDSSPNGGWRSLAFRGFADYMLSPEFSQGLEELRAIAEEAGPEGGGVAILCAEAVPWRCHRSLVSDALIVRGAEVLHIISLGSSPQPHRLTPFAKVEGTRITYPPEES